MLTFLFTDVVGSTRLWESEPGVAGVAMARHDELIETAVAAAGGLLVRPRGEGDSRFAVFTSPREAVLAAAAIGLALQQERWPTSTPIRVRTAIHTGEADLRAGDYYGDAVNRCARLRSVGHPGQILLTATTAGLVGSSLPDGLALTDLGEHRLKDLTRAEHVHQLSHPELPCEFAPLASLDRAEHNLPVQTSSFVGRDADVEALVAAVNQHRLVTVIGFGGMGKTRLALQAAAELGDGSGDGVWFVDLAAVTDPARVPAEIAAVLSIRETADGPAHAVLRAVAGKNLLLVLDNLEQVLDCAHFIAELLAAGPQVHVLATSREPLRVRGEQQFPIQPMPLPEPGASAEVVSRSEAVRLFVERAVSVRPDFAVTAANAAAVAAVCARLDGQPLALELAAARMKMLTVDSLLQRLQSGQQLLTGGSRDMPERHRTLAATIAWSVDALKPEERELLTAMSILPAPAGFELIEAIAGPDLDTFTLLDSLVEKSLVRTTEAGGETRYGLLVSIRDYALETLDPGQRLTYLDRHSDYLDQALTELEAQNYTQAGDEAHLRYVAREFEQLRVAVAHRRAVGPASAEAALLRVLDSTMVRLGHCSEYLELSDHVANLDLSPEHRIAILTARMEAKRYLGEATPYDLRETFLVEGRRCSDPVMRCGAFVSAMVVSRTEAEVIGASDEMDAALSLIDDPAVAQNVDEDRNNCLVRLLRFANPQRAECVARALITGGLVPGDYEGAARTRLAVLLLDAGRGGEALEIIEPTADPERYFPDEPGWRSYALAVRAASTQAVGNSDYALTLAKQAFQTETNADVSPHETAHVLADIHRARGELADALTVLDRAQTQIPVPLNEVGASIVWRRAHLHRRLALTDTNPAALDQAIAVLTAMGPLYAVRDLLACAVEKAAGVIDQHPAHAARLLGWVHANRRDWVLPFGMDDEIRPLLARVAPAYLAEYDSAVPGTSMPTDDRTAG